MSRSNQTVARLIDERTTWFLGFSESKERTEGEEQSESLAIYSEIGYSYLVKTRDKPVYRLLADEQFTRPLHTHSSFIHPRECIVSGYVIWLWVCMSMCGGVYLVIDGSVELLYVRPGVS